MRIQGFAVWDLIVFLLNAVLFVLIGLQLPNILDAVSGIDEVTLAGYALATIGVVVGTRFLWLFTTPYIVRVLDRRPSQVDRSLAYQRLLHAVIEAQRAAIVQMRNAGAISAEVMRRVERDLDLKESRLEI